METRADHLSQDEQKQQLAHLLQDKEIIVCCGAGGVGKTTSSAALGVAAALLGRRVLVLTIDPARRLADAMGVKIESEKPERVPLDTLTAGTPAEGGRLDIWMLQTQPVFDEMVMRIAKSPEHAQQIFATRMYQAMRQLVAGMQEYMAGESLHQFHTSGEYDLIVLDTPPSRNAIDFLKAPERLLRFLDSRILRVFAPQESRFSLFNRARRLVSKTFEQVAGGTFIGQIQEFVGLFFDLFDVLKEHAETVQRVLSSEVSTHLLVTSTDEVTFQEALYFHEVLEEQEVPFGGFLLNRSMADRPEQSFGLAREEEDPQAMAITDKALLMAFENLEPLAAHERSLVEEHRALYERLRERSHAQNFSIAAPHLGEDIEDLKGLMRLASRLLPAGIWEEASQHD